MEPSERRLPASPSAQTIESGLLAPDEPWETLCFFNDKSVDAPTALVTGGARGHAPFGARSAEQIRHRTAVSGRMLVIPRVVTRVLQQCSRYIPGAARELKGLNRSFPSPCIADVPRRETANAVWEFVITQDRVWRVDRLKVTNATFPTSQSLARASQWGPPSLIKLSRE